MLALSRERGNEPSFLTGHHRDETSWGSMSPSPLNRTGRLQVKRWLDAPLDPSFAGQDEPGPRGLAKGSAARSKKGRGTLGQADRPKAPLGVGRGPGRKKPKDSKPGWSDQGNLPCHICGFLLASKKQLDFLQRVKDRQRVGPNLYFHHQALGFPLLRKTERRCC